MKAIPEFIFVCLASSLIVNQADGQTALWNSGIKTSNSVYPWLVAADGLGNCYVYSQIVGTVTCGANNYDHTNGAWLLKKYDNAGTCVWVQQVNNLLARDLKADAGHVYLCGYNSMNGSIGTTTLGVEGYGDGFTVRLSSQGNVDLVLPVTGPSEEVCGGLDIDKNGNIYVTGTFGPGSVIGNQTLTATYYQNYYTAKYDSQGKIVWISEGKQLFYETGGSQIVVSDDGSSITTLGYASGPNDGPEDTVRFSGSSVKLYGHPYALWAGRLDGNGIMQTARVIDNNLKHGITSIGTDNAGNLYCSGWTLYEDPTLYKYDSAFNLVWEKTDPTNAGGAAFGTGSAMIRTNANGDIFAAFCALGESVISGNATHYGWFQMGYVVKYDAAGTFRWKQDIVSDKASYATGIDIDEQGSVFAAGSYAGSCSIGQTVQLNDPHGGFVAKFSDLEFVTDVSHTGAMDEINCYPNPATDRLNLVVHKNCAISVISAAGKEVLSLHANTGLNEIDLTGLEQGFYLVNIRSAESTEIKKLLIK